MSLDAQRLYELLPAIYRTRDEALQGPLKELLAVIAEQLGVLEEDLAQLFDDQFIETCAGWVVPYIGDLIGCRNLHDVVPGLGRPRAEVAHTIGLRRRKGTAAALEQLARDVTGWSARAVEFFQLLGWTQCIRNHIRPNHAYAPDLRRWELLERLDGPFDTVAHTVDVRSIANGSGRYNIPNVGVFLWRLQACPLTGSPAVALPDGLRYFFHPAGLNTALFTRPRTEGEITHLAEPINVPQPISRRVLAAYLPSYYGPGKSLFIEGVDASAVVVCDLSDTSDGRWRCLAPAGRVAIDPVLGRFALPRRMANPPRVMFHYGFSANIGGGEYDREATFDPVGEAAAGVSVPGVNLRTALNTRAEAVVVQIADSSRYGRVRSLTLAPSQRLEIRAANRHRPTLSLRDDLEIIGGPGSELTVNGLFIAGGALHLSGGLRRLRLRHCTLRPGTARSLIVDPPPGSLGINRATLSVEIDRCILGGLRIDGEVEVSVTDSIIDAGGEETWAFVGPDDKSPGAKLRVTATTVIGCVHTQEMALASNSIFVSQVTSEKRQTGCVRFSYLPWTSSVPRRYRCQPEDGDHELAMRPQFTSTHYGDPGYAQLSPRTAAAIRTGADDESEMGAFHHLHQPQREANLRARLNEYLRFGLEAGPIYVT